MLCWRRLLLIVDSRWRGIARDENRHPQRKLTTRFYDPIGRYGLLSGRMVL